MIEQRSYATFHFSYLLRRTYNLISTSGLHISSVTLAYNLKNLKHSPIYLFIYFVNALYRKILCVKQTYYQL
jgi:hypothetical protein